MAIGARDQVLGLPVMNRLRETINRCPEPMVLEEVGHFVQECGEPIARAALRHFGMRAEIH
jgi:haloalkane dehalogenase